MVLINFSFVQGAADNSSILNITVSSTDELSSATILNKTLNEIQTQNNLTEKLLEQAEKNSLFGPIALFFSVLIFFIAFFKQKYGSGFQNSYILVIVFIAVLLYLTTNNDISLFIKLSTGFILLLSVLFLVPTLGKIYVLFLGRMFSKRMVVEAYYESMKNMDLKSHEQFKEIIVEIMYYGTDKSKSKITKHLSALLEIGNLTSEAKERIASLIKENIEIYHDHNIARANFSEEDKSFQVISYE